MERDHMPKKRNLSVRNITRSPGHGLGQDPNDAQAATLCSYGAAG
jgi:hypothetical protein